MICEYALEPELVATWYQRELFRHFIEQFGFRLDGSATGRIVTQYPRKWKKQVWEAFETNFGKSAREDERLRVMELLKELTILEIRRSNTEFDSQCAWLENAENTQPPFYAILAQNNPRDNLRVMREAEVLGKAPPPLWNAPRDPVQRTAASMATRLAPMLRCATRILFVDPHFRPSEPRWRNPLREFLNIICDGSREVALEYHTGDTVSWGLLQSQCQQYLPRLIPHGFTLTVRRWKNRQNGERLHNRYILTDIGGVQFGVGLDEGDPNSTDDISLLGYESWQKRLRDYGYDSKPAFDLEGEVNIPGA